MVLETKQTIRRQCPNHFNNTMVYAVALSGTLTTNNKTEREQVKRLKCQ